MLGIIVLCLSVWSLVAIVYLGAASDFVVLGPVSLGLGALSTFLAAWPFVRTMIVGPRIQGTWWGELHSSYADPTTGRTPGPLTVAVVIRQSGAGLWLCLHSRESSSITIAASLLAEQDGHMAIVGLYRNEPRLPRQDTSRMHHGGIKLHVIDGPERRLAGTYWTDRGTRGELEVQFVDRQRAHDFRDASELAEGRGIAQHDDAEKGPNDMPSPSEMSSAQTTSPLPTTPDEALIRLLIERFNEAELRQFVANVASREARTRLPGGGVPFATLVSEVVDLFHRDRLLDQVFVRLLGESPPRWHTQIANVRKRFPVCAGSS